MHLIFWDLVGEGGYLAVKNKASKSHFALSNPFKLSSTGLQ